MTRAWMVWVLVCLGLLAGDAFGQEAASVRAELSRTSAYVGDEVIYSVVVQGERPADRPEVVFPASVRAQDMGVSESSFRSVRVVNGQRVAVNESSLIYQYRLTVLQPGVVEVPPAAVRFAGGRQMQTGAARFDALLPQLASGFELWVELDRRRLYLGETVTARVVWMIPESIGPSFDFDTSLFDPSLDVATVAPTGGSGQIMEFRFFGRRAIALAENIFDAGGRQRIRFAFDLEITPRRAGIVDIGPARVVFDRGGSGGPRVYAESDPITVEVVDLPTEGRPAGFTGLIGRYELRTLASPTTVNVGDPITVRAELRGEEPMVGADTLADLAGQPGFGRFRLSGEGWREEQPRERGRRVFATTVRALSDEVTALPPVTVWAFDPELERYVEISSEPVQLDVRSVREATLADAVVSPGGSGGRGVTPGPRDRIGPADAAFWAAPNAAEIMSDRAFRIEEQLTRPAVVATIASGPVVILGAGVFVLARRRRSRPELVRDRALRQAEHLVLRTGPGAGVRAAGAAVLGCDRAAVTAADIERLPAHAGIVRTLREAIEADESGGAGDAPAPDDTRLAIRTLRRAVRPMPVSGGEVAR
jgi:hypothetical protein